MELLVGIVLLLLPLLALLALSLSFRLRDLVLRQRANLNGARL